MILIDVYRHDAWHLLFGNKTLTEIIALLKIYRSTKFFLFTIENQHKEAAFNLLFGEKKLSGVIYFLERVQRLKLAA